MYINWQLNNLSHYTYRKLTDLQHRIYKFQCATPDFAWRGIMGLLSLQVMKQYLLVGGHRHQTIDRHLS